MSFGCTRSLCRCLERSLTPLRNLVACPTHLYASQVVCSTALKIVEHLQAIYSLNCRKQVYLKDQETLHIQEVTSSNRIENLVDLLMLSQALPRLTIQNTAKLVSILTPQKHHRIHLH
jgi:hypothetical protein